MHCSYNALLVFSIDIVATVPKVFFFFFFLSKRFFYFYFFNIYMSCHIYCYFDTTNFDAL